MTAIFYNLISSMTIAKLNKAIKTRFCKKNCRKDNRFQWKYCINPEDSHNAVTEKNNSKDNLLLNITSESTKLMCQHFNKFNKLFIINNCLTLVRWEDVKISLRS